MASDAERLIHAIAIDSYIQRFVPLKRKAANLWGLCPFHSEKTPSFSVSQDKNIFKCFGCGKGGNVITYVMEYDKINFVEALQVLSDFSGIELEKRGFQNTEKRTNLKKLQEINEWVMKLYQKEVSSSVSSEYLQKRGVLQKSIEQFRLGYAPENYRFIENEIEKVLQDEQASEKAQRVQQLKKKLHELGILGNSSLGNEEYNRFRGRLMFPIFNLKNECIAFGGRILQNRENTGKYVNSPESVIFQKKKTLYNLNFAKEKIREAGQAILVEGYLDVIGLYQKGIENAIAPLGTAFTEEQASLVKRYADKLVLFFDSDNAGIEASFKSLIIAQRAHLECRVLVQEGNEKKDPFDISIEKDQLSILSLIDSAKSEMSFVLWYFFSFSHNLDVLAERRMAIDKFFHYLQALPSSWEQQTFISRASEILRVSETGFFEDFQKFMKGETRVANPRTNKAPEKRIEVPRVEKEILALLLRYSHLWQKESLLTMVEWYTRDSYLLFTFFRDRLKAGEFWTWQNLAEVAAILPSDLAGLLSGIVIEFDEKFSDENEEKETNRWLEQNVYSHRIQQIDRSISLKQKELVKQEAIEGADSDEIAIELENLLQERARLRALMV